jgi:hypothetical protein
MSMLLLILCGKQDNQAMSDPAVFIDDDHDRNGHQGDQHNLNDKEKGYLNQSDIPGIKSNGNGNKSPCQKVKNYFQRKVPRFITKHSRTDGRDEYPEKRKKEADDPAVAGEKKQPGIKIGMGKADGLKEEKEKKHPESGSKHDLQVIGKSVGKGILSVQETQHREISFGFLWQNYEKG